MRLRTIRDERGIALVTALMMTLISMAIIMGILYMINQSVVSSGAQKRYKSALEAAYGGSEVVIKEVIPLALSGADIASSLGSLNNVNVRDTSCFATKLRLPTSQWGGCSSSLDLGTMFDIRFTLPGTSGQSYNVSSKVVDTIQGNTDTSGVLLTGYGVTETPNISYAQHIPYIYRVEIQGARAQNAAQNAVERANLSVVYAY